MGKLYAKWMTLEYQAVPGSDRRVVRPFEWAWSGPTNGP